MKKRTVISFCILLVFVCLLIGSSLGSSSLWANHFSHWSILSSIALLITLLMGLVLMDDLFELDGSVAITLKTLGLKVEIKKFLVLAFLIICVVSIILELVQFVLSQGNAKSFRSNDNNWGIHFRYCSTYHWFKVAHEESGV